MPSHTEAFKKRFQLAVVTHDPRFGKKIVDEARRRGLEVKQFGEIDDVPLSTDAVIVKQGEQEPRGRKTVSIDPGMDPASAVDKALETGYGKQDVAKAVVVIDPGKTTGAAFFADEILLRAETFFDHQALTENVANFFKNHLNSEKLVYVGEGAPVFREKLIQHLISSIPDLTRDMVKTLPEKNSSRLAGGKDEIAAAIISSMRRTRKRL
ncbi:MAG: hypothetical protein NZ921_04810 [Candidatus Caldarchaeum sp.]|nr:hypothetical protein [Candidatus Caldarchaeum sp.]MCS7134099.1 hypothetical protein [Candidatus Caldarchaeum sp.]MCX8201715.1 hypothetical protein [Candidatus Caldarchaeum sp.]MDW8435214.1 hypothetical protein [Candidatus Caldarchaeum sp.]